MVRPDLDLSDDAFSFMRDGELCVVGEDYFILANINLPIQHSDGYFTWTCWISLSQASFDRMNAQWNDPGRADQEAAFGWLSSALPSYDQPTLMLKAKVHTLPIGERPWVELEPTDHPLAREQGLGISMERIAAIYHAFEGDR